MDARVVECSQTDTKDHIFSSPPTDQTCNQVTSVQVKVYFGKPQKYKKIVQPLVFVKQNELYFASIYKCGWKKQDLHYSMSSRTQTRLRLLLVHT